MKAVAVLLFAMVATSQAGLTYLRAAPYAPLAYSSPLAYNAPLAYSGPVVYSAPKVHNVEIPIPVITKANFNLVTDSDKISTTEIKPFGAYAYAGYPYPGAW